MRRQQTDILSQPIPVILLTFALVVTGEVVRALTSPFGAEGVEGVLSPVGVWIDGLCGGVVAAIAGVLILLVGSLMLTRIIGRYSLSVIRSFVPMVLFAICVCGVLFPIGSPALLLAVLMIIHATELMIMSFKRTERFGEVMRAAFWTGMAALLVPDMVYVVVLLPIQWLIWQRSPREMVAGVIMLLLPLLPASFCYWVAGESPLWLIEEWGRGLSLLTMPDFGVVVESCGGVMATILLGTLVLLTLASIVLFLGGFTSMRLRARKGHIYFTLLYLVSILLLLFGVPAVVVVPIMGFASVPLIHTFLVRRKGVVGVVIYITIVLLTLVAALLPQFGF